MDNALIQLRDQLVELHKKLRDKSYGEHNRMNPFSEDLFDWKERGEYWAGAGKNVTIYNTTTVIGDVNIGSDTWVGPFCALDGSGGLTIGNFCSISSGVQVVTHDTVRWALSGGREDRETAPIRIGDCCFIGSHAIITKGVSIGNNCLIGAGAVVTEDIPSFSIAAGLPAKVIGTVSCDESGQVNLEYFKNETD